MTQYNKTDSIGRLYDTELTEFNFWLQSRSLASVSGLGLWSQSLVAVAAQTVTLTLNDLRVSEILSMCTLMRCAHLPPHDSHCNSVSTYKIIISNWKFYWENRTGLIY